jgi:hypothetical protein
MKRIHTKEQLKQLAEKLGVRPDWHEPDEQSLNAFCFGGSFDNAGHWGDAERFVEMFVVLYQDGVAVAEVNLATLFAFACDTYQG